MTDEGRLEVACDRTMKAVDSMKGRIVELEAELAALRERAEGLEEVARWAVATIAKGPPSAYTTEAVARRLSAALAERPRGATP